MALRVLLLALAAAAVLVAPARALAA
ncbi:MAG: hypothetical protein QOE11_1877, partial [Solirubrobacteraceae bacterium]|nr:hypothetical protein [Solirubrobacteraceae bacterium]